MKPETFKNDMNLSKPELIQQYNRALETISSVAAERDRLREDNEKLAEKIGQLQSEKARLRLKPKIVCICGSSRFCDVASVRAWEFEKQGEIALSMHLLPQWYWEQTGKVGEGHGAEQEGVAHILDELHLLKIDMADRVFIVNEGGYIGERTRVEIEYATKLGKPITYQEPPKERINEVSVETEIMKFESLTTLRSEVATLRTQLKSVEADAAVMRWLIRGLLECFEDQHDESGLRQPTQPVQSVDYSEAVQFMKEWDEGKHHLSPEDEKALQDSKAKLFQRIKSTLNPTNKDVM